LLDISFRPNKPGKVVVYADGKDARMLRKLIASIGEERAQNALILFGFISKLEKKGGAVSAARALRARQKFEEVVGMSFEEFHRLMESVQA
jgi:hypothetical protein